MAMGGAATARHAWCISSLLLCSVLFCGATALPFVYCLERATLAPRLAAVGWLLRCRLYEYRVYKKKNVSRAFTIIENVVVDVICM